MLSREHERRLGWDAMYWIDRLDRLNQRIPGHLARIGLLAQDPLTNSIEENGFTPIERAFDDGFFDAYLLGLALQHIEKDVLRLRAVRSVKLGEAITLFRRARRGNSLIPRVARYSFTLSTASLSADTSSSNVISLLRISRGPVLPHLRQSPYLGLLLECPL